MEIIKVLGNAELMGVDKEVKSFYTEFITALKEMFRKEYDKFNEKYNCKISELNTVIPRIEEVQGENRKNALNEKGKIDKITFLFFSKIRPCDTGAEDDYVIDFNGVLEVNGLSISNSWNVHAYKDPIESIRGHELLNKEYKNIKMVTTQDNLKESIERIRILVNEVLENEASEEVKRNERTWLQ